MNKYNKIANQNANNFAKSSFFKKQPNHSKTKRMFFICLYVAFPLLFSLMLIIHSIYLPSYKTSFTSMLQIGILVSSFLDSSKVNFNFDKTPIIKNYIVIPLIYGTVLLF